MCYNFVSESKSEVRDISALLQSTGLEVQHR
jgi:hypothetical protein